MKTIKTLLATTLVGVVVLATTVPASAQAEGVALGREGRTFELVRGSYGELFSSDGDTDDRSVLALKVAMSSGDSETHLVPGTEGPAFERAPGLVYFDATDTVFLVWESQRSGIHSLLNLIAFRPDAGWSEPLELSGNPFSVKSDPQFAVTRDEIPGATEAESNRLDRSIIHLVWREDGSRILYSPVTMVENSFELVAHQPFRLDTAFRSDAEWRIGIDASLEVQSGADPRSVMVGFAHAGASGQASELESIQVRVLPGDLVALAEGARDAVLASTGDDVASIGSDARAHIISIGFQLNKELVGALGDGTRGFIDGPGGRLMAGRGDSREALANAARDYVLEVGARLDREGLGLLADLPSAIVRFGGSSVRASQSHYFELVQTSRRKLMDDDRNPSVVLFSKSGREAIVAWSEEHQVVYRESDDEGWSEQLVLECGDGRTPASLFELLEQRVRSR